MNSLWMAALVILGLLVFLYYLLIRPHYAFLRFLKQNGFEKSETCPDEVQEVCRDILIVDVARFQHNAAFYRLPGQSGSDETIWLTKYWYADGEGGALCYFLVTEPVRGPVPEFMLTSSAWITEKTFGLASYMAKALRNKTGMYLLPKQFQPFLHWRKGVLVYAMDDLDFRGVISPRLVEAVRGMGGMNGGGVAYCKQRIIAWTGHAAFNKLTAMLRIARDKAIEEGRET